ncbi:MAG: class I SAM-dependent methyltransferase [Microthrixaceae bacterium]
MTDPWDSHAQWWRKNFTDGADPEYEEQLIPLVVDNLEEGSTVLDLGCGEGQVARRSSERLGCRMIGLEPSAVQLATAVERGGEPCYVRGAAGGVPMADDSVDAVVACLMLEHVEDLDGAISEVARVTRPGGRFLVLLNHPIVQTPGSGWVDDHMVDPPEQYWQLGPYLGEAANREQVAPGVFITFNHRPVSRYMNLAVEHGLLLTRMEEPPPPPGFVALAPEYSEQTTMPRVLFMRFELKG